MRQFDERLPEGNHSPETFSAHFLEKSAATKLFRLISLRNRPPKTFSAHFLGKSAATKLFRLISSGNRPPQNYFGSFPQEIGRYKTFRLISSGNRLLTYSLISSGNRWMGFHSFPQEIAGCGSPPCQTHDTLRGVRGAYFDWTGRGERRRISSAGEVKSRWKRMPTPWRVSDLKL